MTIGKSGGYNVETGEKVGAIRRIRLKELIKITPAESYYFHTNATDYNFVVRQYGINKEFLASTGGVGNAGVVTLRSDTHYISAGIYSQTGESEETYDGYNTLFANGSIKPFICLNSETSKTFEMYNKDSQTSIENASFGKKFINVKEIYEI